ncbi:hypothetical protein JL100_010325 [Skermanella mucosa]|uniref:hypothetical protein n=1 Tax=Skermanella mucosa TaxID=1789672 RepID=UPI00192B7A5A|nr:hypothetical protein [Skermanella mucosa]UEM23110.1 hypothetical protein JL100_010325 [Skermanella mucosa]
MTCLYGPLVPELIIIVVIILLLGNPALPVIIVIVAVTAAAQQQGQTQAYRSRYPHGIAPCTILLWSGERITAGGGLGCRLVLTRNFGKAVTTISVMRYLSLS